MLDNVQVAFISLHSSLASCKAYLSPTSVFWCLRVCTSLYISSNLVYRPIEVRMWTSVQNWEKKIHLTVCLLCSLIGYGLKDSVLPVP